MNNSEAYLLRKDMNFTRSNPDKLPNQIKDGDLVILYERFDSLQHTYIVTGGTTQNRFGVFNHNDISVYI